MTVSVKILRAHMAVCGSFVLNMLVAVFGVGAMGTAFGVLLHPHSIPMVLWRACTLGLVFGVILGFSIFKIFGARSAKWVWTVPALLFGARVFMLIGMNLGLSHTWRQMSGVTCAEGANIPNCGVNFFAFTIPLIRSLSYSTGAYLAQQASPFAPSAYDVFRSIKKRLREL